MRRNESFCADLQIFYILLNTFYRESGYGFITPQGRMKTDSVTVKSKVEPLSAPFPAGVRHNRRIGKMKRKKAASLGVVICTLSMALSGCQDSARTEEEIVIPKQEEVENREADDLPQGGGDREIGQTGQAGGENAGENATAGAIAEQVQAPEHYRWENSEEMVSVKVDAPIILPQGEGFKTWRVQSRAFTQEDYDRVSKVLLNGAGLWNRDEKLMESSHGFTAAEINDRIAELEARKAEYAAQGYGGKAMDGSKEQSLDERIEEWEKLRENAPDDIAVVAVPAVVSYRENTEYTEENTLFGTATVEDRDFNVFLDNNLRADWRWIQFEIRSDEANSNFINVADDESPAAQGLPKEEIRGMAGDAMAAMGLTDFAVAGEEIFSSFSGDELSLSQTASVDQVGYGIYFTRVLEGIPVTYTHAMGATMEEDMDVSWPYESICLIYTKEGFANFQWIDPYQIEKESDEYVFLLPWPEVQGIFEEMLTKKYRDYFADSKDVSVSFEINEVRLGYMRVIEKGNVTEGKMVPVWDFFGKETISYPDASEPYVIDGPYESWLTINAMDGTIIDRELGY